MRRVVELAFLLSFLFSCSKNPFSARHSEPPLGAGGTWETPQSPEVALRNLLFSYNEKVISNYELCLADSFRFSSPEDSVDAVNNGRGDLFSNWGRQIDIGVTASIFRSFSNNDTLSLFLSLGPSSQHSDLVEDSAAVLYRNYTLLIAKIQAGHPETLMASGLATFHLNQEQLNWWTIRWWEDLPISSGAYDWGDFKAEYRR